MSSTLDNTPHLITAEEQQTALVYQPEYYQQVYPNYDRQNPDYKYQHYLSCIQRFNPTPQRWLDFGCANGRFLDFLHRQQAVKPQNLFGTDVNAQAIATAQGQFGLEQIRLGGRLALRDDWGSFDTISALDVLEHLPDLDETLIAFNQQLAPKGLLLAVMPVYDGILGPIVHLLDKDPTHIHKKSRGFWVEKLGQHFNILAWHGIIRYLMPGGVYLNWPTQAFKTIAPAVLVVCQKK